MKIKFLISLLLSLLIIILYIFLSHEDTSEETIQSEISKLEQNIEDLHTNSDLEVLVSEVKKLKQEVLKESSFFPKDISLSVVLRELTEIGDSTGLQILLFEPQGVKNQGVYEEIPIKIKLRGSFRQIAAFFYGVSNLNRIVKIQEMKIQGPVNRSEAIITETDVLFTTYRIIGGA
jgi:type IV pilus assembly protein PilO